MGKTSLSESSAVHNCGSIFAQGPSVLPNSTLRRTAGEVQMLRPEVDTTFHQKLATNLAPVESRSSPPILFSSLRQSYASVLTISQSRK